MENFLGRLQVVLQFTFLLTYTPNDAFTVNMYPQKSDLFGYYEDLVGKPILSEPKLSRFFFTIFR